MKQVILICVLLAALFIPNSYAQESMVADAAVSCRPPTCFKFGDVLVKSYRPGWYRTVGLCIFDIGYISNDGTLKFVTSRYSDNYMVGQALVRIDSTVYGVKNVAMIRFYPKVFLRWYNGRIVRYYNNCTTFRWVSP
jgi:hypothetical protein